MTKWTREKVLEHIRKEEKSGHRPDFGRQDLAGLDLSDLQLHGVNFSGADLDECKFDSSIIVGCSFTEAKASRVSFKKALISRSHFFYTTLRKANFEQADVVISNFRSADLRWAKFNGTDFGGIVTRADNGLEIVFFPTSGGWVIHADDLTLKLEQAIEYKNDPNDHERFTGADDAWPLVSLMMPFFEAYAEKEQGAIEDLRNLTRKK